MESNKTPGSDGLPKEFYAKFFHLFGSAFVVVLNSAYDLGQLSGSQRYGLITLACKDDTKSDQVTSGRAISLLNIDYKILSKFLSRRLRGCLRTAYTRTRLVQSLACRFAIIYTSLAVW